MSRYYSSEGALQFPGEPTSGGQVTITHQMLASAFRAIHTTSLLRSAKILQENMCKTFLTYSHIP